VAGDSFSFNNHNLKEKTENQIFLSEIIYVTIFISTQSVLYCGQRLLPESQLDFHSGVTLRCPNDSREL